MKIMVFTSNQPRHIGLVERLSEISDFCHVVMECNTVYPGRRQDFFNKNRVMERYFRNVMRAEQALFSDVRFMPAGVRTLPLRMGDLSSLKSSELAPCLDADVFVIFGASFIRGWLCDQLVARGALNIHMSLSPYYRGSSCYIWVLYDRRPHPDRDFNVRRTSELFPLIVIVRLRRRSHGARFVNPGWLSAH